MSRGLEDSIQVRKKSDSQRVITLRSQVRLDSL